MRDNFEAQFEPVDDAKYFYRRNQKGEPIPVSAEERERFIRQYMARIWFVLGGMMIALLAFMGGFVWWTVVTHSDLSEVLLYVGIGAISVVAIGLMYWVRGAPARELAGRPSVGRERSKDEMRAISLTKLSYGQLAVAAFVAALLPFTLRSHPDLLHGWGRLWLVFSGALVLLVAVQALRKWMFDQEAN